MSDIGAEPPDGGEEDEEAGSSLSNVVYAALECERSLKLERERLVPANVSPRHSSYPHLWS